MALAAAPEIVVRRAWVPERLNSALRQWNPRTEFGRLVRECLRYLPSEQAAELIEAISRIVVVESELRAQALRRDPETGLVLVENYGVVSRRVVTNNGVAFIVDAFQNLVELETMKYHGIGTGTSAEAASDSALQSELTTQYSPDNTRATGTTEEGASANIYKTVATNTLDSGTPAITEHGIFNQAATGGGVLFDRSVFSAINLNGANGDGLQTDYRLTLNAGG